MKNLILIFSIPFFVHMANVADAYDLYGASITVKEVSMSMWRMGISGNYPIIDSVTLDSPAAKAGLSQGNIILSVNGRAIKNVSDLNTFNTDVLSVKIFKGYVRETIIINIIAIEAEKAKRITEEKKSVIKASAPIRDTEVEEISKDSTPVILNDAILEKKLGKSTYTELARQTRSSKVECVNLLDGLIKITDSNDKSCYKEQQAFRIFKTSGCGESDANTVVREYMRTLRDGCFCEEALIGVTSITNRIESIYCNNWKYDKGVLNNAINICRNNRKVVSSLNDIYSIFRRQCE